LEVKDKRVVEKDGDTPGKSRVKSSIKSMCTLLETEDESFCTESSEEDEYDNESDVDMKEVFELVQNQEDELQQKTEEIEMKDKTIEMLTKKVNEMKKNDVKNDEEVTGVIEAIRY